MWRTIFAAALVTVLATVTQSRPTHAQSQCGARDRLVATLKSTHHERLSGIGLVNSRSVFELWTAAGEGSWTVLVTHANKVSCIVAAGRNWIVVPDPDAKGGAATFIE